MCFSEPPEPPGPPHTFNCNGGLKNLKNFQGAVRNTISNLSIIGEHVEPLAKTQKNCLSDHTWWTTADTTLTPVGTESPTTDYETLKDKETWQRTLNALQIEIQSYLLLPWWSVKLSYINLIKFVSYYKRDKQTLLNTDFPSPMSIKRRLDGR